MIIHSLMLLAQLCHAPSTMISMSALAAAFIEGYSEERAVKEGYLTASLQLLWYMESTWWINAEMDQHSVPPALRKGNELAC